MSRARPAPALVLTCEHAGNRIPAEHRALFAEARAVLRSHRGWDPGALRLGERMARRLRVGCHFTTWSRLLVEANRSAHLPRVWSSYTAGLAPLERERILARYWRPHREKVENAVRAAILKRGRAVHVAVHSFTPVLDGEVRKADIGLLYDSRREAESSFARAWAARLREAEPDLRVRFNYPYRGASDGLTTALRRRHPGKRYLGFELEANQALLASPRWRRIGDALSASLAATLSSTP